MKEEITQAAEAYAISKSGYHPGTPISEVSPLDLAGMFATIQDFKAGWKARGEAAHQRDGWIPVKDRQPEEDQLVLVANPQGVSIEAHYHLDGKWYALSTGASRNTSVTHWQFLPNPPQTQDK